MIDRDSAEFVEALARGLSVLEAFDAKDPEMTFADLSRKLDMSIATVRRNVLTLEALGFIRRHNKHFLLAPRILSLGSSYLNAFNVEDAIMPELQRLTSLFGDAANMAVLDGVNVLYVAHISESRGVRRTASTGSPIQHLRRRWGVFFWPPCRKRTSNVIFVNSNRQN